MKSFRQIKSRPRGIDIRRVSMSQVEETGMPRLRGGKQRSYRLSKNMKKNMIQGLGDKRR